MREAIAGFVTVATAFISASIVYQIVKPGSQGPAVVHDVTTFATSAAGDLFKG